MDGTQVSVLKKANHVGLSGFLNRSDRSRCEPQITLVLLSDFSYQALEGKFPNQQLSALLEFHAKLIDLIGFWNFLISLKATVPGLKRCVLFMPVC